MPAFESRDPATAEFWSERFAQHHMPWDHGGVPEALCRFVAQEKWSYVTLIPGCGNAYEVAYLSEAGWDVTAIDFSPVAVDTAKTMLGRWRERVVQADFFNFVPARPVKLIYERAFLCALPPAWRPKIAQRWAELLAPGGLLAGFFYFDETPTGPPFGIGHPELAHLLEAYFELIVDEPVSDSVPVFAGKERWQIWRRKP